MDDPPTTYGIVEWHAQVDRRLLSIRDPTGFAWMVQRGLRRPDVIEAFEAIALDPAFPTGSLATLSATGEITRARALLARVDLGVGPTSLARVMEIAHAGDRGIADLALAPIDPDIRGAARRLLSHLPVDAEENPRLGGFFVRALVLSALDSILAGSRDRKLHDEVAEALSTWLERAGLATGGRHALPAAVLVTMLRRIPSLDSEHWPTLLTERVGDEEAAARALRSEWLGPRSLRGSVVNAPPSGCSLSPNTDAAPLEAFAEIDDMLCRLPRAALELPNYAIYDVVRATARELSFCDWGHVSRWPTAAQTAALDAIADGEVRADAAEDAADYVSATDTFSALHDETRRGLWLSRALVRWRSRGRREDDPVDAFDGSLPIALARHSRARWRALVVGLADSQNPYTRALAGYLLGQVAGPDAIRCLDTLALDPEGVVRYSVMSTHARMRIAAEDRHIARLVLLTAWRTDGEAPASRVVSAASALKSDALIRRTRRTARRIGLSPRAIAFVDDVLPFRRATLIGTPVREPARLCATDGHRFTTTLLFERERGDARITFDDSGVASFVNAAPSSFVRLEREGHADRAIQIVQASRTGISVEPADPRLLGTVL